MGGMYAVTWNNKNYKDYSTAYKDIMYDAAKNLENPDAWSKSWQDLTSMAPEDAINNSNFKDQLKRQKDYFRRYRDLSIIITVGVYALSIVDAYVDAQLFDFDISPDLSLHLEPVVSPKTSVTWIVCSVLGMCNISQKERTFAMMTTRMSISRIRSISTACLGFPA